MPGLPQYSDTSSDVHIVTTLEVPEAYSSVALYEQPVTGLGEVSKEQYPNTEATLPATNNSSTEEPIRHNCLKFPDQTSDRHSPVPTCSQMQFNDHTYDILECQEPERGGAVHPHYTGDYERAPDYVLPSVSTHGGIEATESTGDYERDPNYSHTHHSKGLGPTGEYERDSNYSHTHHCKGLGPTGDYERDPNYSHTHHSKGLGPTGDYKRDPNYSHTHHSKGLGPTGDYERDPLYHSPQPQMLKQPVVPHHYSALLWSTLDSPQEYTTPQQRMHQ